MGGHTMTTYVRCSLCQTAVDRDRDEDCPVCGEPLPYREIPQRKWGSHRYTQLTARYADPFEQEYYDPFFRKPLSLTKKSWRNRQWQKKLKPK